MVSYFSLISLTWWLSFHRFASSLKIAFVGDTGVEDPKHDGFGHRTMKMIEKEGVNLVINVGDFEYWGRCHERYEVTTEKMFFEAKDGKSYSLAEKEQLGRYQWLLGTREPFSGWQIGFENAGTEETLAAVSHETWKGMERNLRLTSEEKCNGGPWDGPWEWRQFVRNYNFDFLAASGNHEVSGDSGGGSEIWADHQKYMWNLYNERIFETGRGSCRGYHNRTEPGTVQEYGERYSCIYNDQHILFLGWHQGSDHSPKSSSEKRREKSIKFIEREFSRHDEAANNVRWRYCVHHMTASKLSPGPKKDNMRLFGIVDACRKHGALIISGHYHIYGRTKMLKSVGSDELYPIVSDDENQNKVMENQTMSIVVGNGGYTGRCDGINEGSSWMEICLAGEKYRGALIATFDDENPWKASFHYRNSLSYGVENKFKLESRLPGWNKITAAGKYHKQLYLEQKVWQNRLKAHKKLRNMNKTSIEIYPYGNRRPFNADLQMHSQLHAAGEKSRGEGHSWYPPLHPAQGRKHKQERIYDINQSQSTTE